MNRPTIQRAIVISEILFDRSLLKRTRTVQLVSILPFLLLSLVAPALVTIGTLGVAIQSLSGEQEVGWNGYLNASILFVGFSIYNVPSSDPS